MIFYYILKIIIENPNKGSGSCTKNSFCLPLSPWPTTIQLKIKKTHSSNVAIPTTHGLKHSFIQSQLEASLIKHLPLVRITSDETVHLHSFALPNSMTTRLGLVLTNRRKGKDNNIRGAGEEKHSNYRFTFIKLPWDQLKFRKSISRWNYCPILQTRCQQILVTYF